MKEVFFISISSDVVGKEIVGVRILGFVGIEKHDIIIFLSRIICNLNKKVLIIDNGYEHISPPLKLNKSDCRKVDFMKGTRLADVKEDYDVIFINFSIHGINNQDLYKCTEVFTVTDLQNQSIICISEFLSRNFDISKLLSLKKSIILRDSIKCKIKPNYVFNELKAVMGDYEGSYILNYDDINYKYKVMCQYDVIFKFNGLSNQYENMLMDIIVSMGFDKKITQKAYKMAKRGE